MTYAEATEKYFKFPFEAGGGNLVQRARRLPVGQLGRERYIRI